MMDFNKHVDFDITIQEYIVGCKIKRANLIENSSRSKMFG